MQRADFEEQLCCLSQKRLDKWKVQFFTFCYQLRAVDGDEVGAFTLAGEGDTHCLLQSEKQRQKNCRTKI